MDKILDTLESWDAANLRILRDRLDAMISSKEELEDQEQSRPRIREYDADEGKLYKQSELWPSQVPDGISGEEGEGEGHTKSVEIPESVDISFFIGAPTSVLQARLHSFMAEMMVEDSETQSRVHESISRNNFALCLGLSDSIEEELNTSLKKLRMDCLSSMGFIADDMYIALGHHSTLNWVIKELIQEDQEGLELALSFLAMICIKCVPLPQEELRKLDVDLIECLLDIGLRNLHNMDDSVLSATVNTLFCVSLQFPSSGSTPNWNDNPLLQIMNEKQGASELGNTIVVCFNRANPLFLPGCLKFLQNLFHQPETADFFFRNDLEVLVDVIIRELTNLSCGDESVPSYLEILYGVLKNNSSFRETMYKRDEIEQVVSAFLDSSLADDPAFQWAEKVVMDVLS